MRCNTTLFERLADPEKDARRSIREDAQEIADSVMRHLQKLLNTRQGHAPIRPDYGMPDFTDCAESLPATMDKVRRAIKDSIEAFEPRLRRVKITHLPSEDSLQLHFGISGQLATGKQKVSTFFSTRVAPTGSAEVDSRADVTES
ncbi:MAG: type VI secretion system baseplate subunit TssE [Acidobacteria bacterium]|nr:type VI secretion system baseplate subunit TssE [Acidobacteriota bacterium]